MAAWVVITGHSRGMGEAMALQSLSKGRHVIGISRKENPSLASFATSKGLKLEQWKHDLANAVPAAERVSQWINVTMKGGVGISSLSLINNAAVLGDIAPLHECSSESLILATRVGLEAPMLLMQAFLSGTQKWVDGGWEGDRKVLNISSGLGRSAMASAGSYCAVKAGLDHLSRSVALDQALLNRGAKIVSLAPGVISTDMQVQLRTANETQFPSREKFIGLHKSGSLDTPEQVLLRFVKRPKSRIPPQPSLPPSPSLPHINRQRRKS